jgi:hypothetical protein
VDFTGNSGGSKSAVTGGGKSTCGRARNGARKAKPKMNRMDRIGRIFYRDEGDGRDKKNDR